MSTCPVADAYHTHICVSNSGYPTPHLPAGTVLLWTWYYFLQFHIAYCRPTRILCLEITDTLFQECSHEDGLKDKETTTPTKDSIDMASCDSFIYHGDKTNFSFGYTATAKYAASQETCPNGSKSPSSSLLLLLRCHKLLLGSERFIYAVYNFAC